MELNALGEHIYLKRINKTALCDNVNISRATLYKNMEGPINLAFCKIIEISKYLNVPLDKLAGNG